ncbi:MAG: hypothetical protein IKZ04_06890 [Spirochaetaceae bacterium]|nr:hypothetical protein [Spirochaetaceae bacterium]
MENKILIPSFLTGTALGTLVVSVYNIWQKAKLKKLTKEKIDIIAELNKRIGYKQFKLDEIKETRRNLIKKNIFKRFALKSLKNIDSEIKIIEYEIKNIEKQISEICSCKSLVVLREKRHVILIDDKNNKSLQKVC